MSLRLLSCLLDLPMTTAKKKPLRLLCRVDRRRNNWKTGPLHLYNPARLTLLRSLVRGQRLLRWVVMEPMSKHLLPLTGLAR